MLSQYGIVGPDCGDVKAMGLPLAEGCSWPLADSFMQMGPWGGLDLLMRAVELSF